MTATRRTLLGTASLVATLPLILPVGMLVRIALVGEDAGLEGFWFAAFIAGYVVGLAALATLIVVYAVDAFRKAGLSEGWQAAWLVLLLVVGVVAVPVYWWRHIRTREDARG